MLGIEGKIAVVTGSSRGTGADTVKLLAANGARVAVNYNRSESRGRDVLDEIVKDRGEAILVKADVTEPGEVQSMFDKVREEPGPPGVGIKTRRRNNHV